MVSVDAYITTSAAVRDDGILSYVGYKPAERIVIDFPIIKSAPERLNRAGVGDVYCSRISLLDWRMARDRLHEEYSESVATQTEEVIDELRSAAPDIRAVTDDGVRTLIKLHSRLYDLSFPYFKRHKPWPNEGMEHIFFYALEKELGRSFVHGEPVGTGAVVAAYLHREDVSSYLSDLDSFGLRFRPTEYG